MPLDSSRSQPSLPGLCPVEAAVAHMAAAGAATRGLVFTRRAVVEWRSIERPSGEGQFRG